MNTHSCSVPGCNTAIASHLVMCLFHWRHVYPSLQSRVYSVFRKWRKGTATIEELRAVQAEATKVAAETAAAKGGAA